MPKRIIVILEDEPMPSKLAFRRLGVSHRRVHKMLTSGMSHQEIVDTISLERKFKAYIVDGLSFNSRKAIAEYLGVDAGMFIGYCDAHSVEEAVEWYRVKWTVNGVRCRRPSEVADALGVSRPTFLAYAKRTSVEDAIRYYGIHGVRSSVVHEGKSSAEWAKEFNITSAYFTAKVKELGSADLAVMYFEEALHNTTSVSLRSLLRNMHNVTAGLYLGTCPNCGRRLLVVGKEAVGFQHSEEFCSTHVWEE